MVSTSAENDPIASLRNEITMSDEYFLRIANEVSSLLSRGEDFKEAVQIVLKRHGIMNDWNLWFSAIGSELGSRSKSYGDQKNQQEAEKDEIQEYREWKQRQKEQKKYEAAGIYVSFGDVMSVLNARRDSLVDDL